MPMKNEPYVSHGLAIVNPYGGVWTDKLFETPEQAVAYLKAFWPKGFEAGKWKLAQATQTIEIATEPGQPLPFIEVKDHI